MLEPILIAGYSCCVIPTDTSVKGFDMSARKTPDAGKLDRLVAEARHNREQREQGYREQALKLFPWSRYSFFIVVASQMARHIQNIRSAATDLCPSALCSQQAVLVGQHA